MSKHYCKSIAFFCAILTASMSIGGDAEAGSANGGGQLVRPDPNEGTTVQVERIGFTARQTGEDLDASGQVQYSVQTDGKIEFKSHLRVDCIGFFDENTVIIGCTVLSDSDPDYIGTTAGFLVRDNGEGKNAPADERSRVFYSLDQGFDTSDCEIALFLYEIGEFDPNEFLRPIESGNYQVKP